MTKKQALVVISFGTTCPTARTAIESIEHYLAAQLPDHDCFRAFTSSMVIRKLQREQNLTVPTPEQLIKTLVSQGYTHVVCQPLHILNGWEYEKMCRQLAPFAEQFQSFLLGKPMLTDFVDYQECCRIIAKNMPMPQPGEALVLMGHGSDHFSNAAYSQLESTMRYLDMESIFVGTVEGFPNLDFICKRLKKQKISHLSLFPFLIVAGAHAQNDMAGEEESSWKSVLERQGYTVTAHLKGLGEFPETGKLFARHLMEATPFPNN